MNQNSPSDQLSAGTSSSLVRSLLILVLLSPCAASAVIATQATQAPALTLPADRPGLVFGTYMIPAGRIPENDSPIISRDFEFLNKGQTTVRITEIVPSCGCLSPTITSREIQPDQVGRLTLPIRTANESAGLHEYLVTVRYEDPKPRQVTLTCNVNLPEKQIIIQPRVLMVMGKVTGDHPYAVTISDHRADRQQTPMKITSVETSSTLFSAEAAGGSFTDGVHRSALSVTFHEPIPAGQHKGVVVISTDDQRFPILQVPVVVGDQKRPVDEFIAVSPDSAMVVIDATEPEHSLGTTVKFDIPAKWKVSHLDAFPAQLAAKILSTESVTPDRVRVTAEIAVSSIPTRGLERGVLTLHATDHSDPEMVTVPISLSWK